MFEYTSTDIEKRLEALDSASLAFIRKLPTFLCSEIRNSGISNSMTVKFGTINNITANKNEVLFKFTTLLDFGDVDFSSNKHAQDLFGADRLQLYRTHWAVREGDAQEILTKLAQLKPELADAVSGQQEPDPISVEPPLRTKNMLGSANSVESFLELFYKYNQKDSRVTFFRGHEDPSFELIPSLLRKWPNGVWKFMPNEDQLCKELLIAHYEDFQSDQYCFDRLVRMQHYELPTRLLDISSNPLVALFFACHDTQQSPTVEGEVIIFRLSRDNIKYYDSDTVSCLANLSNLTYDQKAKIDIKLSQSDFNNTDIAKKLLHHIKSEKGFFEGRIVPDHLGSVVCVKAKRNNTRIKSQSGAFLLFGHEAKLPDSGLEGIQIAHITITNKKHILDQLSSININATTVYPGIDETSAHLKKTYLIPGPSRNPS